MIVTVLRNRASRSGRALADSLGVSPAYVNSQRRCRGTRYVINWGVSTAPEGLVQDTLIYSNFPAAVARCVDKFNTLLALVNFNIPCIDYSTESFDATRWLEEDGKIVVRHITTGHSGEGIQIVRKGQEIPIAPLYTRYFTKQAEYRVHVFYGRVILIQQKRRMRSDRRAEGMDESHLIRTHGNGWAFTLDSLDCHQRGYTAQLEQLSLSAANAVGIEHGAVDVLVNHDKDNLAVVCEINSAPSLEGESTLNAYTEAFLAKIGG